MQEIIEPKKLYPFQDQAVTNIFNQLIELPLNANLLFQLPTGGGKTIIFSEIAKRFIEKFNRKVLILTHRIELGKQTSNVLTEAGITNKIINSEVKQLPQQSHYQSFIALVETLNNRLQDNDQFIEDIGLVIVDEAHNNSFRKIFHYFKDVNILGVTATPLSSNKKLPLYQTYQSLIVGESISNLITQGYLCDGKTFSYDVNLSSLRVGNNGEFTVELHSVNNGYLTIINAVGQIIVYQRADLLNKINIKKFEKGIYFVSVSEDNKIIYRSSFIKE